MKRLLFRKYFPATAIILVVAGFVFFSGKEAKAQFAAVSTTVADVPRAAGAIKDTLIEAIIKAGRVSFLSSLRSLVNQFAYDTATYVGSGGQGQKPVYFTKEFGPWLREQGANVGGQFIEEFAATDQGSFIKKYNICSPDLSVSIKISLGLTDFARDSQGLSQSRCNLKEIYQSGQNQVELFRKGDYLKNLAITAFDPTTTDVGAALSLFDQIKYDSNKAEEDAKLQRIEDEGWIPAQSAISKKRTAPPQSQSRRLQQASDLQTQNFFTQTGDIFVDAANIFLNQLALSAFNKLIDNLSKNSGRSSSSSNYYSQGGTGGITEVARQNSSILQARFNERADYDILSQLSSCSNENRPGPTNCVITQQFAQAINERLTIAEAITRDIIDPKKRIGFDQQGNDLTYQEGYPYRSLIILRKYRILPVGWEVAAQYIKDFPGQTKDITLGDLINCFDAADSYKGFDGNEGDWCRGLIDPHWVLKVPKMFCGMEGYGPEILSQTVVRSETGYCTDTAANCDSRESNCKSSNQECTMDEECGVAYPYCNYSYGQEIQIDRNQNYCADEQSCIKENNNGSCAYYGYCTEEKRRWVFSQTEENSCEPRNNTCQTFKNETGQEVAFLENTLDYDHCDAGQVGCKQYALTGPYVEATKKITWDPTAKQAYFNKNISTCESSGEGCHQYIRTKDNLDTNIIGDASFEDSTCITDGTGTMYEGNCKIHDVNPGPGLPDIYYLPAPNDRWIMLVNGGLVTAGIVQTEVDDGTQSLYIKGSGTLYSDPMAPRTPPHSFLPEDFRFEPGHYYTLSARVYAKSGNAFAGFGLLGTYHVDSTVTNQWQTLVMTFYYPFGTVTDSRIFVGSRGGEVYVDSIKLTAGRASTAYSDYGSNNVIYQKILPAYLEATCYQTGGRIPFRLKDNAPDECKKFAKKCNADEVGCESLTSLDTGISVTAKTTVQDTCPGTCIGYNTYVQQANSFNAKQAVNLIPSTARTCGAQAVGCTAFTNLDKLSEGGEAIEYYSAMRKCIKPDTTKCLPFYTWEGSDESGYQLKVYSLQKDPGSRLGEEPLSTLTAAEEALLCNATIFQKLPSEPGYNYDCRQFYAQDGTVSYHLYQKTISCSDDCHPYRRELNTPSTCLAGNGDWDASQSRCLYYAIPGEGTTCAAADAGCQEYTGNIASNTRNVFTVSTFEDNTNPFEGWQDSRVFTRVNTALNLGGHSLLGDTFTKLVGEGVKRNKSYTVSFLARASAPTAIGNIELFNGATPTPERAVFSTTGASITTDWKLYSFNLTSLDHEVTSMPRPSNPGNVGEKLKITFADQVFIDNIRLIEVPNRFYLIRNSWTIPEECDEDFAGASAPGYMLGCSQYKNADSTTVNLHSFTDLCDDASAGCEAVIDTFNSTDYKAKIVNDDNNNGACDPAEKSCIYTPADKIVNVIYDRTKQCEVGNKGCQRMGLVSTYDTMTTFSDIYINNNPDRYGTTVCTAEAVGCSKWSSPDGDTYFKDPGDQVCEWRLEQGSASNSYQWFRKKVKKCGGIGSGIVCSNDSQCAAGVVCTLVTADEKCGLAPHVTPHKTLGNSANGNKVLQPANWAGICESSQAGCSEYIDPISKFNVNLVKNPNFEINTLTSNADYWTDISTTDASQTINLNTHTLYIVKGSVQGATSDEVYVTGCSIDDTNEDFTIYELKPSTNTFDPVGLIAGEQATLPTSGLQSGEFYIATNNIQSGALTATCQVIRKNRTTNRTSEVRQGTVEYQLRQNLDKSSPNGLVSFSKSNILFNERLQNGSNKARLTYNADATPDVSDGVDPDTSRPQNSNVIIKAQADRVCGKWLACNTYVIDSTDPNRKRCLDVGLCNSLDSEGKCNKFIAAPTDKNQDIQNLGSVGAIANLSGYSKVGYRKNILGRGTVQSSLLVDYYNLASMSQNGDTVALDDGSNGSFEKDGNWTSELKAIFQPREIAVEALNPFHSLKGPQRNAGINLPPSGQGMARVNSGSATQIETIPLVPGKKYVISSYIYNKGSSDADIILNYTEAGVSQAKILLTTTSLEKNTWLYRVTGFIAPFAGEDFKLELKSVGGDTYFDEVKIESGLNIKCSGNDTSLSDCTNPEDVDPAKRPWYISSICRLYPKAEALGCEYTDQSSVKNLGLKGYCLEYDPKNVDTCLLWYPLDKIASDSVEEGVGVTFNEPVYYCDQYELEPRYVYRFGKYFDTSSDDDDDECDRTACGMDSGTLKFTCESVDTGGGGGGGYCPDNKDYHYNCIRYDRAPDGLTLLPSTEVLEQNNITNAGRVVISNMFSQICSSALNKTITNAFICSRITGNPTATTCTIRDEVIMRHFDDAVYYDFCGSGSDPAKCKSLSGNINDLKKPRAYCSRIVKVNKDKPWNIRTRQNTVHQIKCYTFPSNNVTAGLCSYSADAIPYGSARPNITDINFDTAAWSPGPINNQNAGNALIWKPIGGGTRMGVTVESGSSRYYTPGLFIASPVNGDPAKTFAATTIGKCGGTGSSCTNNSNCPGFNCVISYISNDPAINPLADYQIPILPRCASTRPVYDSSNPQNSYCYIDPIISNFKIKGTNTLDVYVRGSDELPINFDTKTDVEQQPLRSVTLNLGYRDSTNRDVEFTIPGHFADGSRNFKQVFDYYQISRITFNDTICAIANQRPSSIPAPFTCGLKPCCVVQPKVTIKDNWGIETSKMYNKYVVVEAN